MLDRADCSKTRPISIDSHRYPFLPFSTSSIPLRSYAPSPIPHPFPRPLATSKLINDKINWSTFTFRPCRYQSLNETRSVRVASYSLPPFRCFHLSAVLPFSRRLGLLGRTQARTKSRFFRVVTTKNGKNRGFCP